MTLSACLRAGVARREITPPAAAGVPLWGYWGRNEPAAGTLDPLYARVLVLRGAQGSLALITLDLGRTPGAGLLEPLRAQLLSEEGLDGVIFSASHTHAGPSVQPHALEPAPAAAWMQHSLDEIRGAVKEASALAQPVRVGFGSGTSWIGNNRRWVRPDGSVQMISRDSPKVRNFPVDPGVRVARLDRRDGTPLAVIVHYACHPVTLGADNMMYSADWPGAMIAALEERVPGRPMAMFLQGALGDINLMQPLAGKRGEIERLTIGRSIGEEAARMVRSIQTIDRGSVCIRTAVRDFSFANRWDCDQLMKLSDANPKQPVSIFRDEYAPVLSARVNVVAIGGFWSWITMPGEPFVAFQTRLTEEAPIRNAWLLGCADGYLGYFPTIRATVEGGYGAQGCETWVEVGAGEWILDQALFALHTMNGQPAAIPAESC